MSRWWACKKRLRDTVVFSESATSAPVILLLRSLLGVR